MKKYKRGFCPICHQMVVGLYQMSSLKPKWVRRAFYCRECETVLKIEDIVYKKIIFEERLPDATGREAIKG